MRRASAGRSRTLPQTAATRRSALSPLDSVAGFLGRNRTMGVSVGSRSAGASRFILCCVLALFAFGAVAVLIEPPAAHAQEPDNKPAEGSKEKPDFFTHLIKSAGIFFGPLLLLVSIVLV